MRRRDIKRGIKNYLGDLLRDGYFSEDFTNIFPDDDIEIVNDVAYEIGKELFSRRVRRLTRDTNLV